MPQLISRWSISMIINKSKFYRQAPWKNTAKRIKEERFGDEPPFCESCGKWSDRLAVHHVYPIPWDEDGNIEVDDITELLDCVFDILCKSCHDKKEKGGDVVDLVTRLVNGKEI